MRRVILNMKDYMFADAVANTLRADEQGEFYLKTAPGASGSALQTARSRFRSTGSSAMTVGRTAIWRSTVSRQLLFSASTPCSFRA